MRTHPKHSTRCAIIFRTSLIQTGELKEKIYSINLNISGRVNPESGYSYSSFYFSEQPVTEILSKKLNFKVGIDNDTRAMAYGRIYEGSLLKEEKQVIFINISWGLGIGIIIDGNYITENRGFRENLDTSPHSTTKFFAIAEKKGCLETETAGIAIHRMVLERIKNGESVYSYRKSEGFERSYPYRYHRCHQYGRPVVYRNY